MINKLIDWIVSRIEGIVLVIMCAGLIGVIWGIPFYLAHK